MSEVNVGGRPLKYPDPEAMAKVMDSYFEKTPIEQWTVTGLALSLGLTREGLDDYQARQGYRELVKMAKLKVEHAYEMRLISGGGSAAIFGLKNFGWTDKSEVETSHTFTQMGDIKIGDGQQSVKKLVFNVGSAKGKGDDDSDDTD